MTEQEQGGVAVMAPGSVKLTSASVARPNTIGYWTSAAGQQLIESFGGWKESTSLSCWLAQSYPHLYGSSAGVDNLWGQKNRAVAAFVQVHEMMYGAESEECLALAEALDDFARSFSV